MNKNRLIFSFSIFFILITVGVFFQNCGIQRPQVELSSYAVTNYLHTGTETSCSECHENKRPTSTNNFVGLNANTPFDYSSHAVGMDCIHCHAQTSTTFRTMNNWSGGSFAHLPILTSCANCHSSQRPGNSVADLTRTSGFDHTLNGSADCFGCHQASFATNFTKLQDWHGGIGVPASLIWDTANDITLTEVNLNISNTSISSGTQTEILHMGMNHGSTALSASNIQNCTLCHDSLTNLKPGYFHSALSTNGIQQPTLCSDCHNNANTSPSGFVGVTDVTRNPQSPAMKHKAVAWSKSITNVWSPTSTILVQNDCSICHAVPTSSSPSVGNGWSGAQYHNALNIAGLAQPTSCIDCHANSRIASTVNGTLTNFNHSTVPEGMGDCVSCHTSKTAWSGGVFHNTTINAGLTSCNNCHNSQRPTTSNAINSNGTVTNAFTAYNSAVKPFDLNTHGDGQECNICHSPTSFSTMASWTGGQFHKSSNPASALTTCVSCHSTQKPSGLVGPNTYVTPQAFSHTLSGQGDCIACHKATVTANVFLNYKTNYGNIWGDTDWKGGETMPSGLSGPDSSWTKPTLPGITLNSDTLPLGQIVATTNSSVTLLDQMLHSSTQIPSTYWTGSSVGNATGLDPSKCISCHANYPTSFAGGRFHAANGGPVATSSLTSCKDCHVNTTPTLATHYIVSGTLATNPMNHWASLSNNTGTTTNAYTAFDCFSCHGNSNAGTSFSGALFHTNLTSANLYPTNCTTCHYETIVPPTVTTGAFPANTFISGFKHTSTLVNGDCQLCHVFNSSSLTSNNTAIAGVAKVTSSWSNGKFHANKTPSSLTSCTDCHATKPAAIPLLTSSYIYTATVFSTYNGSGVVTQFPQHMNHTSPNVGTECANCHNYNGISQDLSAGATPTSWSQSTVYHASIPNPGTCKECHGLTNGGGSVAGTNNDIPAAITNSSKVTTSSYALPGTYDQIVHTESDVASQDCNICHTTVGMTANGGKKWTDATFHIKYSANSGISGRCDTCHINIKPTLPVSNGFDHSTIGTSDCGTCHNYPGTGSVGAANWLGAVDGGPHTIAFLQSSQNSCVNCHTMTGSTSVPLGAPITVMTTSYAGKGGVPVQFTHDYTSTTAGSNATTTVRYQLTNCLGCHSQAGLNVQANNGMGYKTTTAWVGSGDFKTQSTSTLYAAAYNHKIPSVISYNGTTVTYSTSSTITACMPCHNNEFTQGHSSCTLPKQMTDCVRCHTAGSWSNPSGQKSDACR